MKMIIFKRGREQLTYNGKTIWAWNRVRSLANKKRLLTEVVYSEPTDALPAPYDPVLFPIGTWEIGQPVTRTEKYLAPFFIPTNAVQRVTTYELQSGIYYKPNGTQVDGGYGIHFSTSSTTLGCIRVAEEKDLLALVEWINEVLRSGESVKITVME
jgi:hypothetical protein